MNLLHIPTNNLFHSATHFIQASDVQINISEAFEVQNKSAKVSTVFGVDSFPINSQIASA